MIRGFYTARSGLISQQRYIDIHANNIANIQTTGFKKSRPVFADLVYTELNGDYPVDVNIRIGNGSGIAASRRSQANGIVEQTGRKLDLAIGGNGYFAIDNGEAEPLYTRDGSFQRIWDNGQSYLGTASGGFVLDQSGSRILLPESDDEFVVTGNGYILINSVPVQRIAIMDFDNPEALEETGGNLYRRTGNSGLSFQSNNAVIYQGHLEDSNVNLIDEITSMIKGQRAFQLNAKIIQTADEMEGTANNLR